MFCHYLGHTYIALILNYDYDCDNKHRKNIQNVNFNLHCIKNGTILFYTHTHTHTVSL